MSRRTPRSRQRRGRRPMPRTTRLGRTLALRELRRLARLVQAGLLALDDPGVPREEAGSLERDAELRVGFDEGAGDAVANGACLAARPASVDADAEVERALDADHLERRQHLLAVGGTREVLLDRAPVEPGRPVARP